LIRNIIFDFDGVILDSVPTKTEAFKKLFEEFPQEKIEQLVVYHEKNGGISRYIKIKYFFEEILRTDITKEQIDEYAVRYSELTKEELTNPRYLIQDSIDFIRKNQGKYRMHVASGADEGDLRYICEQLHLNEYFLSINGSPNVKTEIVAKILADNSYDKKETILIGDSVNDYEAASKNEIMFYGYNNVNLQNDHLYITTFTDFL